jgi:hypothetical protein
MTYKFLNTIIDDLFAFVIKMPLLHRLSGTTVFLLNSGAPDCRILRPLPVLNYSNRAHFAFFWHQMPRQQCQHGPDQLGGCGSKFDCGTGNAFAMALDLFGWHLQWQGLPASF